MRKTGVTVFLLLVAASIRLVAAGGVQPSVDARLQPYVDDLMVRGRPPIEFVLGALKEHDLLIFDDGLHPLVEPFTFYQDLVRDPRFAAGVRCIFIEALSMSHQADVDAYMNSEPVDLTLLYPALQDDFSGEGWPLQSYLELLHTIREQNRKRPAGEQYRVVGVANSVNWDCIRTPEDLEIFRRSLATFDYMMYQNIVEAMDNFQSGLKGVFLTNTRHAYAAIRHRDGGYYWNCGTFFRQWHPAKTISIRIHTVALQIEAIRPPDTATPATTAGMEKIEYRWVRVDDGLWDSAFQANRDAPVAFTIRDTAFGRSAYVGNHMLDVFPGTKMSDAYDALMFLAPIEKQHRSATVDCIYTPAFLRELARRYRILYSKEQLEAKIAEAGEKDLESLLHSSTRAQAERLIPEAAGIGPIDAWKSRLFGEPRARLR